MHIPNWAASGGEMLLKLLSPENAHRTTLRLLKAGFVPSSRFTPDPVLSMTLGGLEFKNPVGLAAGFDKNAEVPDAMLGTGFGSVEIGAVTPLPQDGNPKPRLFRLFPDKAIINRMGFNNEGLEIISERMKERAGSGGIVGVNLGANKESKDRINDYVVGLKALYPYTDYYTVNISSPNTPGLRNMQSVDALTELLTRVLTARKEVSANDPKPRPVFLKIAPDLSDEDLADIAAVCVRSGVDGVVISNTTIARPTSLISRHAQEAGGLSGAPLMRPATKALRAFYQETKGALPLIGVGGISSARDAYEKILNGASLVQLYSALLYEGIGLPSRIVSELPEFLAVDGFADLKSAVGADL